MLQTSLKDALVLTQEGYLRGTVEGDLRVFKGIPYAAPPVGDLRFRAPVGHDSWRGIREAKQYGAAAIQGVFGWENKLDIINSQYEEDCLYLNVWTPAETGDEKLPVFMWIHGGGLVGGSGVEPVCCGEMLARMQNMVVVTINYRLGFYGFFAHPDLRKENEHGSAGNYGFLDMRQAAIWVKENIAAFGGDPDNVTIAGQSGGAVAVGAILASPLMKGLAKRVCIESGPAFWGFMKCATTEEADASGVKFMERAGLASIDDMRKMDAWELYDLSNAGGRGMGGGFNYSVDGWFLPETPAEALEAGRFNDFEVMVGNTSQEFWWGLANGVEREKYEKFVDEKFGADADKIRAWYPAGDPIETGYSLVTLASDCLVMSAVHMAECCEKKGTRAYVYLMTKAVSTEAGERLGSAHGAEMPFLFGQIGYGGQSPFEKYTWIGADYAFMDEVMTRWHGFALNGDPNGKNLAKWEPCAGGIKPMVLGLESGMIEGADLERYEFLMNYLKNGGESGMVHAVMGLGGGFGR